MARKELSEMRVVVTMIAQPEEKGGPCSITLSGYWNDTKQPFLVKEEFPSPADQEAAHLRCIQKIYETRYPPDPGSLLSPVTRADLE